MIMDMTTSAPVINTVHHERRMRESLNCSPFILDRIVMFETMGHWSHSFVFAQKNGEKVIVRVILIVLHGLFSCLQYMKESRKKRKSTSLS